MQIALHLTFDGVARSDALAAHVRDSVAKLERFHPRITSCRVAIGQSRMHSTQGRQYEIRIELRVPGHLELVSSRHHDEDVYVALRDAFAAITRQLEDAARVQRADVKTREPR